MLSRQSEQCQWRKVQWGPSWPLMFSSTVLLIQKVLYDLKLLIASYCKLRNSTGEPHTNMPADMFMEHENKAAKEDIAMARG